MITSNLGIVSLPCYILLAEKYSLGDFEISKKIGVFFIQVTPTKFRVWRLSLPDNQLYIYIYICLGTAEIPTEATMSEEGMRKLTNMLRSLKSQINESFE